MKTLKINKLILLLLAFVVVYSCVEDDDFNTPDTSVVEPEIDGTIVEVQAIKALLEQEQVAGNQAYLFNQTNNYLQGYIISNDEAGNFFEELIIQNNFENPTAGIKLLIDVNPLFVRYELGRKVYIKLDGLSVGMDNGVVTLGIANGNDIEKISSASETEYILRSSELATIIPNVKTLAEISENDVNTLIQLNAAQFTESQLGLTYASESTDEFDGDRTIESCDSDGGSILMQTSTFSDFKSLTLPSGTGTITAILSKDFFGEQFTLNINTPEDVNFIGERCEPTFLNPNIAPTTTIDAIIATSDQEGGYFEFDENETDLIVEGYIISSDEKGNFFEELIVQSTPNDIDSMVTLENGETVANPRRGIRVSLNRQSLYQEFQVGRKIYIKLNGLAIDLQNGVYTIGYPNVSELQQIPDGIIDLNIFPGEIVQPIIPKIISILDLTENDENTWIQFNDVQINRNQLDLTYSGEPSDEFDGERTLETCPENNPSIVLQTSTFSDFKSLPLPQNRGYIQGVITRDFFDDFNVIIVNSPEDINFDNPDRCDPDFLECTGASGGGSAIFSEDFESFGSFTSEGWVNVNVGGGGTDWVEGSFSGNAYAQITGFNANDDNIDVWLVTPTINMDSTDGEEMSFDIQVNFDNGTILTVWVSTDFTGDPTTATWQPLDVTIPTGPGGGFGSFESVAPVNISCLDGDINIGFFYEGADPGSTTRYHVDNVEVTGN